MTEECYCCVVLLKLRFCMYDFRKFLSLFSNLKKMYHLNYYHSILNVYYTRIFGIIFSEFKYWISVRCLRSGLLEIFRFFTTLLKNSWKISGTFSSFEIIFSFAIGVINLTLFGKRGTFFVFSCDFYFRSKRDTYVRGYPTVPAQKP